MSLKLKDSVCVVREMRLQADGLVGFVGEARKMKVNGASAASSIILLWQDEQGCFRTRLRKAGVEDRKISETQRQNKRRWIEKSLKSEDRACVVGEVRLKALLFGWIWSTRKVNGGAVARLQVDCERINPGVSET